MRSGGGIGITAQPAFIAEEISLVSGGSLSLYCKLYYITQNITVCLCLLSLFHLALIAMERYLAMKYSVRYETIVTRFRLTVAIAWCWLITKVYFVTRLRIIPGVKVITATRFGILTLLLIIFCHVSVYFVCRRHMIQIRLEQVSSEATTKFLEERKVWKTTTIIIDGVILSYLNLRLLGFIIFPYSVIAQKILDSLLPFALYFSY